MNFIRHNILLAYGDEFGGRAFKDVCQYEGGEGISKRGWEESQLDKDRRENKDRRVE